MLSLACVAGVEKGSVLGRRKRREKKEGDWWVPSKSNKFPRSQRVQPCVLIGECNDTWLTVNVIGSLENWWALCKNIGFQSRRSLPPLSLSRLSPSPPSPSLFAPAMQAILSPLNLISYSLGDFHIEETGMPFGTLGVAHAFFYPKRRQFNLNTLRDTFVGKTVFFCIPLYGGPYTRLSSNGYLSAIAQFSFMNFLSILRLTKFSASQYPYLTVGNTPNAFSLRL